MEPLDPKRFKRVGVNALHQCRIVQKLGANGITTRAAVPAPGKRAGKRPGGVRTASMQILDHGLGAGTDVEFAIDVFPMAVYRLEADAQAVRDFFA